MIGLDDFFDCYLPSEVDTENISNIQKQNNHQLKLKSGKIDKDEQEELKVSIISELAPIIEIKTPQLNRPFFNLSDALSDVFNEKLKGSNLIEKDDFTEIVSESSIIDPPESDNFDLTIEIFSNQIKGEEEVCSIELSAPDYSELLSTGSDNRNEMCCICKNEVNFSVDPDDWLICYGCGEAAHIKCLKNRKIRTKCEFPIIYRTRLRSPEEGLMGTYSHAPWFCNSCVTCSKCPDSLIIENNDKLKLGIHLKDSFVACRHCGKVSCLACYNCEPISNGIIELNKFEKLKNYSCSDCLRCINCGLNAIVDGHQTQTPQSVSTRKPRNLNAKTSVLLYSDYTLCRPCFLSNQICATCPRCKQIYHSLPDHYDFGEAPYNSEFSLCPMVSCDDCGGWTHCQCEGISEEEYERIGNDSEYKFVCFNCSKSRKKQRISDSNVNSLMEEVTFRIGNLMLPDLSADTAKRIIFLYWSLEDAWKRVIYELCFDDRSLIIKGPNNFKIEAKSLENLTNKFVKTFQNQGFYKNLIWFKAFQPQMLLNPMNLLNFLESAKVYNSVCDFLREEVGKITTMSSAKTQPFDLVNSAHVKAKGSERNHMQPFNSDYSVSRNEIGFDGLPEAIHSTGKMTVKLLYMQYLQSIRSDTSISTINAYSLGLALRPSPISGFGLFACKLFRKNALIIEYCGEMLTGEDLVNKRDAYYNLLGRRYQHSCYLFRLDELKVLDATHKGNLSRFINHSCEPNCYSRVVQIDGNKKLLIFASKMIEAGEEILYDYKFPDEEQKIPCLCGSQKCRKWMN